MARAARALVEQLAQIVDLVARCEAQLAHHGRVTASKRSRCALKTALALEAARQRLLIHLSTLAAPTLKPIKAVEATDRRRLLGQVELPKIVCQAVASELARARQHTACHPAATRILSAEAAFEQAAL